MHATRLLAAARWALLAVFVASCDDAALPTAAPAPAAAADAEIAGDLGGADLGGADAGPAAAAAEAGAAPAYFRSQANTALCARVRSADTDPGTPLVTYACGTRASQRFTLTAGGLLTAYDGAACVTVSGGVGENGAALIIWPCHGRANQRWALAGARLVGMNGRCAVVRGGSTAAGARLVLEDCRDVPAHRWTVVPAAPPAPAPAASWTWCTNAGAVCDFHGLRTVRLGGPSGPYVEQTAITQVPCAVYGFGGVNPAPGQPLHCDYGPLLTTTLANPMPGMGPLTAPTVVVPRGDSGAAGPRARAAAYQPSASGSGSFRTTCTLATYRFDDPIVFPGRPGAAHLHVFFGNTAVDASSTPASLAAGGHSSCRGGTLNRTAYWVPALIDTRTGAALPPADAVVYYKTGYNVAPAAVQTFPAGLRMIAGDMRATGAQRFVEWGCRDRYVVSATVPTACPPGDAVRLTIIFPQCWDGVRLDAPDHKSHMAYPVYRNAPERSTCPATHPVTLPEITEHFDYPVTAESQPSAWRLSSDMYAAGTPGGLSAHADWMNGWDPATMRTIVTQCLNRSRDCGVGAIGDGRELY